MRFSPYLVCFGAAFILEKGASAQATIEGKVMLPPPPAGHHALKPWLGENDIRSREVDLKPAATMHVDFPGK